MDFNKKRSISKTNAPLRTFRSYLAVNIFLLFCVAHASGSEPIELQTRPHKQSVLRVKTIVEVEGSLHPDGSEATTIPMQVMAELFYDERGFDGNAFPVVRHYWEAKATLEVGQEKQQRDLRKDRQLIVLSGSDPTDRFTSPLGPLSRHELDLIDVTANGYPLELLLPQKPTQLEGTWVHDKSVTEQLLRLEELESGQLTSKLGEVADGVAKIELSGTLEGQAEGATTRMEVSGNYQVDIDKGFVRWFAISLQEDREACFRSPGFNIVAQIRSARKHLDRTDAITTEHLEMAAESQPMLEFSSDDGLYRMALDRRWHLISDRGDREVLRMVDGGDLLATCRIDRLNKMPPNKQLMQSSYQKDVQNALGKSFEHLVSAETSVSPQGVRVLRVVARGTVSKTPIQWIYCHLSNQEGYCLSCIFTLEDTVAERFRGLDEALINSVELLAPPARQAQRIDSVQPH